MQENFHSDAGVGSSAKIDFVGLRQIADRLAKRNLDAASEQMTSMITALESNGGRSPGPWTHVDVFSVFSVSELAHALNPQKFGAHLIEGMRNVGIFAPLLLTWWRLSTIPAGVEFKDAVLGVGGEVFGVLAVLVIFSVASELIERRRSSNISEDERRIAHLLRSVSLHLSEVRANLPAALIEGFRSMSTQLQVEMDAHFKSMHEMTTERVKEIADLRLLNDSLAGQLSAMKGVSDATSTSVERVRVVIGELMQHAERLSNSENSLSVQMRKVAEELMSVADKHQAGSIALKEQTEAHGRSVRVFDAAMVQVTQAVPTLVNVSSGMSKMYTEFLDRMTDQTQVQQELTEKLEAAASGMVSAGPQIARVGAAVDEIGRETTRLANAMTGSMQSMNHVASALDVAAKTHESASQRFDSQTSSLTTVIGLLDKSLIALEGNLPKLVGTADGIGKMHFQFLNDMAELADEQRGFVGDLSTVVQEMKGVSSVFEDIKASVEAVREQVRLLNGQLGQTARDSAESLQKIESLASAQTRTVNEFVGAVTSQSELVRGLDRSQNQLLEVGKKLDSVLQQMDASQGDFRASFQQIVNKEHDVFDSLKTALDVATRNGPAVADLGKQLAEARNALTDFNIRLVNISSEMIRVHDQLTALKEGSSRL
jgi:hypothetical protein